MLTLNKLYSVLPICNISVGLFLVLKRLVQRSPEYIENDLQLHFSIYYSTETGNSRMVSELFKNLLVDISIDACVHEINSIFENGIEQYNESSVLVFVISTCGNGSFPASSRRYIRYLSKMIRSGNKIFSGIKYTIIGLGSSIYEHTFNLAANKLDKLIYSLGGERFCEIALLDEVNGNELDFSLWWSKTFLYRLGISDYGELPKNVFIIGTKEKDDFICKLRHKDERLRCNHSLSGNCHISESYFKLSEFVPISRKLLCESKVNEKVNRQTFNLQLKIPDDLSYKTFDIIDVLPPNPEENVNFFSQKVLGMRGIDDLENIIVDFIPVNNAVKNFNVPFPDKHSLMHVLRYYFDLITLPPHKVIMQFIPYLNKIEGEIISCEGFFNENKGLYEFSFPLFIDNFMKSLIPIPIEAFVKFDGIRQRLRSYSISSSSLCSPSIIDLTVCTCIKGKFDEINSNRDNIKNTQYIKGLCSSFLFEFDLSLPIFGMIRPSSLNINSTTAPILMFSHGSGIAPIRALLHERKYFLNNHDIKSKNPAYFFYGCRTENEIIYKNELDDLKSIGVLTDVFFALSKSNHIHVKDLIPFQIELILKVICQENSIIYICGKHEFSLGIKNEIASTISENLSKDFVKDLFVQGRFFIESWN